MLRKVHSSVTCESLVRLTNFFPIVVLSNAVNVNADAVNITQHVIKILSNVGTTFQAPRRNNVPVLDAKPQLAAPATPETTTIAATTVTTATQDGKPRLVKIRAGLLYEEAAGWAAKPVPVGVVVESLRRISQ